MEYSKREIFYQLDEVDDLLSPSAQKVFQILLSREKMHVNEIAKYTEYSPRTIQNALKQLTSVKLIIKLIDFTDMRRCYYAVNNKTTV